MHTKSLSNGDILTCFFFKDKKIGTINYIINKNSLSYYEYMPSVYSREEHNSLGTSFIKTEVNYNRSLAFVWYHFSSKDITYYIYFNPSVNQIEEYSGSIECSNEIYKNKINKIPKYNEIDFTCENNDKKIKAYHYNSIDNYKYNISPFNINTSCESIEWPAIVYYNNNQNYYIYYCFKNNSDEFHKNDSNSNEENNNSNLPEPYKKKGSNKIIIYIIIAVSVFILLVISIFIYKRYFRKGEDQKLAKKLKKA